MRGMMVAAAILLPALALAQVPPKLGYQGRLLKSDGTPETGSVAITFAIYDAETAGTLQWSEVQPVELTNGFYSVFVGDQTSFPTDKNIFDGRVLWLEVTVGSSAPLTPRQRIASVAYALTATNVTGGTVDATSISASGSIHANGGVTGLPSPNGSSDAATKAYVDGKFPVTNAQQNFGTPSASTDVATKGYVDGTALVNPSLSNNWATVGGAIAPGYRKMANGRVFLEGHAAGGSNNTVVFTLPAGFRPAAMARFMNGGDLGDFVEVRATGDVVAFVTGFGSPPVFLDGVSFFATQ